MQLLEVEDVGDVIAASVFEYLHNPVHLNEIDRLRKAGLRFGGERDDEALSDSLRGMTIVVSGNFSLSRDRIKQIIAEHGGKAVSSVSGNTSFLLAGTKPGPEKLKKCAELGIEIKSEEEFVAMLPPRAKGGTEESVNELSLF